MANFIAFLRVTTSLLFVLFLAWWCTRYLLPRLQGAQAGRNSAIVIVERIPLGMRSTLCLVRVGERYYLIGLTPGGMEYLAEIPADELQLTGNELAASPDFSEILAKSKVKVSQFREQFSERVERVKERKERGHADEQQKNNYDS